VPYHELSEHARGEPSASIRQRVVTARQHQWRRNRSLNAHLRGNELRTHAELDAASSALLAGAMQRERLSARGHDRIIRVARTIADLAGAATIARDHVAEALLYRRT
jgi:magnesium chelatase family protein